MKMLDECWMKILCLQNDLSNTFHPTSIYEKFTLCWMRLKMLDEEFVPDQIFIQHDFAPSNIFFIFFNLNSNFKGRKFKY